MNPMYPNGSIFVTVEKDGKKFEKPIDPDLIDYLKPQIHGCNVHFITGDKIFVYQNEAELTNRIRNFRNNGGMYPMYFIDEQHKTNFTSLCSIYGQKATDLQYRPNIYLASIPEIYKLLDLPYIKKELNGPLNTIAKFDEERDMLVPSHAGITGSTRQLVYVGLSLFNGNPCDLDFEPSPEYGGAIIEALLMRFNMQSV